MSEHDISPDSDTRDFGDVERANGDIIYHHQYTRGCNESIVVRPFLEFNNTESL